MKTILLILLIGSVSYNVYQYYDSQTGTPKDCFITEGYEDGIVIEPAVARECYTEYESSLVSPDVTTGGIISRKALDALLCMKDCNGIAYSLARDKSGVNGPENSGAFIILEGVNVQYDSDSHKIISVSKIEGSQLYRPGNWCPPTCMAW